MKYNKNEKGVALLLALGFAALLLVLIMGFATNALIDRKVAANNGDKTQARSLAMSAVNRAVVAMQYHMLYQTSAAVNTYDQGVNRFDNIVSKSDDNTSPIAAADLEGIFKKIDNNTYLFEYRKDFPIYEYPLQTARDYNYNGETKTAAFNLRRLPQWQYVKNANNSEIIGRFMYAALPDVGRVYKKAAENFDYSAKNRTGRGINEFDIAKIEPGFVGVDFKHPAKWYEDISKPDPMTTAFKTGAFFLFNMIETDSDINIRNEKFRNDNGSFDKDMVNIFSLPQTLDSLFESVPYLNEIESGDKTDLEKQIAANLIMAFNPPSGKAFTDDSDNPTFMGNGRTPYINELEFQISNLNADIKVTYTRDVNGDITKRTHEITPRLTAKILSELYDPYKAAGTSADYSVTSDLDVEIEFSVKDDKQTFKFPKITAAALSGASLYHELSADSTIVGDKVTIDNVTANYTISAKIKYLPKAWKFQKGSDVIDFANIMENDVNDSAASDYKIDEITVNNSMSEGNHENHGAGTVADKYIYFQVKDARVNLAHTEWKQNSASGASFVSNIGSKNTNCVDGGEGVEIAEHFPDVSNKAKVSLADLAFISRGVAGKTLDILHIPVNNTDLLNDKRLLDQLTVYDTTSDSNPQLIDINSRSIYLWKGLIGNVKDLADSDIIFDDPTDIAKKISAAMATSGPLKNRSDFVKILTEADSSIAADKKQALLGKILPICKVEDYPEYAHLIVVAQTVKDNQGLGTPGTFDANDEVTSEVRYLVRLHRKPDNKMEIVWMEELSE